MNAMANPMGLASSRSKATGGRKGRWLAALLGLGTALAACGKDSPSRGEQPPGGSETGDDGAAADAGVGSVGSLPSREGDPPLSYLPPLAPNASCMPGATTQCLHDQLCQGVATCSPDGAGFGPCECPSTPAAGGGIVGAACKSDADCAAGATCFRADGNAYLGAGGPAGGYCTFPCSDTNECAQHDPESRCVPMGANQSLYCIRTCLSKDAEPGEAKCLNRPDLVCVSEAADGVAPLAVERQPGYCAPRCSDDSECPGGRVCHRQAGICTDGPAPGAPTGSRCTFDTDCDGKACEDRVQVDNGDAGVQRVGTCTAECVLGAVEGCGYAHDDRTRKAACITALVSSGRFSEGPGDLGLCRELCDVDSDCLQAPVFFCRPLTESLVAYTGRKGACSRSAN
ncbi:MAG TPA: hypothetical protein VFS67_32510 [Polyangiaceae bacterium]|jgi:hypothetical protein|nr:hypothetical protein [Polyangiaceae bacterium]